MGCFNSSGFISRLPIRAGDRVVCFIGLTPDGVNGHDLYDPDALVQPFFLPIRGSYDDYGSVCNIDKTPITEMYEKYSNMPIESLLESVERCLYGTTIDDNLAYWSKNHDEEEVKMYQGLKDFIDKARIEKARPVLMMEHEEIYDKITENFVESGWWYRLKPKERLAEFYAIIEEILSIYQDNQKRFDEVEGAKEQLYNAIPEPKDHFDRFFALQLSFEFNEKGDEKIVDRLKKLNDRMNDFYGLIGGNVPSDTMSMFRMFTVEDMLKVYTDGAEELRRFYNLWVVFARAPMYFTYSQTAGMQEFDYELHERVLSACYDKFKKDKKEYDDEYADDYDPEENGEGEETN